MRYEQNHGPSSEVAYLYTSELRSPNDEGTPPTPPCQPLTETIDTRTKPDVPLSHQPPIVPNQESTSNKHTYRERGNNDYQEDGKVELVKEENSRYADNTIAASTGICTVIVWLKALLTKLQTNPHANMGAFGIVAIIITSLSRFTTAVIWHFLGRPPFFLRQGREICTTRCKG